jgi:hypothetical protein
MARVRIPHADQPVYLAAEALASHAEADVRCSGARLRAEGVARDVRRVASRLRIVADPRLRNVPHLSLHQNNATSFVRFPLENERDYLSSDK